MTVFRYTPTTYTALAWAPGDIVELEYGEYLNQFIGVKFPDITIRGIPGPNGELPHFKAVVADGAKLPALDYGAFKGNANFSGKGLCVVRGDRCTIESIEFSGMKANSFNGAGIRHEAAGLSVKGCLFHDNENGILGSEHDDPATPEHDGGLVWIEGNGFFHNGAGDGQSHNLYISRAETLVFIDNDTEASKVGHLCKTRAKTNVIVRNTFRDGDGNPSYHIDIDGGLAIIAGNEFERLAPTTNPTTSRMIYYYLWHDNGPNRLFVTNNRMASLREQDGHFVAIDSRIFATGTTRTGTCGQIEATIKNNVAIFSPRLNGKGTGPYPHTWGVEPWITLGEGITLDAPADANVVVPLGKEPADLPVPYKITPDTLDDFIAAITSGDDDMTYKQMYEDALAKLADANTQAQADIEAATKTATDAQTALQAAQDALTAANTENAALKAKIAAAQADLAA